MARIEWKRICCPVDFSKPSRAALETAVELARRFEAELTIFHAFAVSGLTFPTGDVMLTQNMIDRADLEVDELLGSWKKEAEQLGAPKVSATKAIGVPFVEIVRFAREGSFDLIIMGTHGRTGLKHALLGSVAEKVVRKAPCPVLTVRPKTSRAELP